MKNRPKWIWLAQKCGQGSSEVLTLVEKFNSIEEIYGADYDTYVDAGVSERLAERLSDKSLDGALRIIMSCQSMGAEILCYDDEKYPVSLRSLRNPPAVLYYVGRLPEFNKALCVSVVGTRKMSEYGKRTAYKIAYEIASSDAIVVSGMALGIDGVAAAASIAAGGTTVAVLGSGIDVVYPKEHTRLFEMIKKHGAVMTEYPPSSEPIGMHFPMRNRIISGLSQGVVVVDADLGSGAMITAESAILQGRDIYAVPSNIGAENSSGTNSLIRDGAQVVLCGYDVIKNYAYIFRDRLNIQKMRNSEKRSDLDEEALAQMGVSSSGSTRRFAPRRDRGAVSGEGTKAELNTDTPKAKTVEDVRKTLDMGSKVKTSESVAKTRDDSAKMLATLSEKQRKIFEEMPLDKAVTVDYLTRSGFKLGEVISALTVLEIKGLISSLPGALYVRK